MAPFLHEELKFLYKKLEENGSKKSIEGLYNISSEDVGLFNEMGDYFVKEMPELLKLSKEKSDRGVLFKREKDIENFNNFASLMINSENIIAYYDAYNEICNLYKLAEPNNGDDVFRRTRYGVLGAKIRFLFSSGKFSLIGTEYVFNKGSFEKKGDSGF